MLEPAMLNGLSLCRSLDICEQSAHPDDPSRRESQRPPVSEAASLTLEAAS